MRCTWRQAGPRRPLPVWAAADGRATIVRAAAAGPADGRVAVGLAAGSVAADAAAIEGTEDRTGADPAIDQ